MPERAVLPTPATLHLLLVLLLLLLHPHSTLTAAPPKTVHAHLFFVASPPYHGNELLSQLFSTCTKVVSTFNTAPQMGGHVVLSAAKSGLTKTYDSRKTLFYTPTQATLAALPVGSMYADTNPMFAHTYHDIVLRDFASNNPVTILLLRDHPSRALSRLERHSNQISFFNTPMDATQDPNRYTLYTPHSRLATTRPLNSFKESSEQELLIGYLIDMESRRQQIRAVASRRRKVNVIDVWYDELTDVESARYLLETRLLIPNCNTTQIEKILVQYHQSKKEEFAQKTLQQNEQFIQNYLKESRKKIKSSKTIAVPSMALPTGIVPTEPEYCIFDNAKGCAANLPVLDVPNTSKRNAGNVFFYQPLQLSVGEFPSFSFGVNKALPMPDTFGKMRSAIITTELIAHMPGTFGTMRSAASATEVGKVEKIVNKKVYTAVDSTRVLHLPVKVLQLRIDCSSSTKETHILCHPMPLALNRTQSYHVRLTVTCLQEKWVTLGWFSFA